MPTSLTAAEAAEAPAPIATRQPRSKVTSIPAASALLMIGVFLVLYAVTTWGYVWGATGDTLSLVAGARKADRCIAAAKFIGCGYKGGTPTQVFGFPLLQYPLPMVMTALGFSDTTTSRFYAHVSLAALGATLVLVVVACRRIPALRGWTPVLPVTMLTGPLLYYGISSYGEMVSAFTCLLFVVFALERRPLAIAVTLTVACLGKETLFPFLLVLGLVCAREHDDGWLPPRRMLTPLLVGTAVGVGLSAALNVFRYASPLNRYYLRPEFQTPWRWVPDIFLGLFFSQSGGILFHWFSAFVLMALAAFVGFRALVRDRRDLRTWLPPLVPVAVFIGFQGGLARWAFPFGWLAWGPRLTVPIVPAVVVAVVAIGGEEMRALFHRGIRHVAVAAAIGALVIVSSLPQSGVAWSWYPRTVGQLIRPSPTCPPLTEFPALDVDPDTFFRCFHKVMWRRTPSFLAAPVPASSGTGEVGQAALAAGVGALVLSMHRRARARPPASVSLP